MARNRRNNKWKHIGTAVVITAAVILLYPFLTDIYSHFEQTQLVGQQELVQKPSLQEVQGKDNTATEDDSPKGKVKSAPIDAWGYLNIPSLGVTTAVVEGTTPEMLTIAPGWYTESALPGQGNTAIAGHLNCYGSYFRRLYTLGVGDQIFLTYKDKIYCYTVESVTTISSVSDIIFPCGYNALTLTTCTTEDKEMRTGVRARLVSVQDVEKQQS
ncbi:MAG TPA: sortase [Syntrophomonadaceae bacterium]|nr:sortase [Syntrophomonadaceae bacterium]